jgi:deoxyribonuclease-4
MSIAGGLSLALTRGLAVGCSVVQIFLKNQRQWTARPYTDSEVREFRAAWKASGIRVVFAHANYLINLATPVPAGIARWTSSRTSWSAPRRWGCPSW